MNSDKDEVGWLTEVGRRKTSRVQFSDWTQNRLVSTLGTNAGTQPLPFQTWHRFKEAYAPELIDRAVRESSIQVNHLVDVFGGSGTSALSAQFLGIPSTSIEINPFLADVILAKTEHYASGELVYDLGRIVRHANRSHRSTTRFSACPLTFIEPGSNGRYLFPVHVAEILASIQDAIDSLDSDIHRRLFRVLLGGILVGVSNATVSGKGRRYRGGWQQRRISAEEVLNLFITSAIRAILEIHTHTDRPSVSVTVLNADARTTVDDVMMADLFVFSPPYPNSFDYTDVYNLELWMLGYLSSHQENRTLRHATLSSHVQIKRDFATPPQGSQLLNSTLESMNEHREQLWCPWIPEMVGGYFADMGQVLAACGRRLNPGGHVKMVVGDSQYAGIRIAVDKILIELAPRWGLTFVDREPFRSMRASAQQGGKEQLSETLVTLAKD